MRSSLVAIALGSALFVACNDKVCVRNSDCEKPLICGDVNTCVLPPDMTVIPDGGIVDGSSHDSSAATDLEVHEDLADTDAAHD